MKALFLGLALTACAGSQPAPLSTTVGPEPALPAPHQTLLPTVNIATATGWPKGQGPKAAPGLTVNAFASGLEHPRWIHVLPNGDVLVAEANKQPSPVKGVRDLAERLIMGRAGARAPSADRISLLRDADGDGIAEGRSILLDDLTSPFGMALLDGYLYIANTDALVRVPFRPGQAEVTQPPEHVADLPANGPNRHWTKGLLAHQGKLYVSVGSNSDHGENGLAAEQGRAAIWQVDPDGEARLFATGLRNPVGMDVEPTTGAIWTVVNERDELGDNLVPDYLTEVPPGGWFGWPFVYWQDLPDPRVDQSARPDRTALRPDYALGAHVAPLGLTFADGADLGQRNGAYVGLHGSWNRVPASGYEVVFIPFANGQPSGDPQTILSGFRVDDEALGRPVGVEIARDGALLVADDVGNTIWRVAR